MMATRNTGNVELALCNESDGSERTSSDRTVSEYDMVIAKRLQYLTQRVEDLERKLEKRMPMESDDLSFALSVDNNNSVPNVDIKVFSGPREPYYNSTGDEDLMSGWDDGIVERNTSFLIIPVGDDKDLQLSETQRLKQTLDGALEPTGRLPALCCTDTHDQIIIDTFGAEESLEANQSQAKLFTTHRAISVNVYPSGNVSNDNNNLITETRQSTSDSSSINSNECSSDDMKLEISASDEKKLNDGKEMEEPSDQQDMEKVVKNMERLNASSSHHDSLQVDGTLRYGYTISVAGVSSQRKNDGKTEKLPIQPRVFNFESNHSIEKDGKDVTLEKRDSDNKLNPTNPCYIVRSTVLPTSENICYQDVGVRELYERNDNEHGRLNRNTADIDYVSNDRLTKIDPGLSKHHVLNQNFGHSHICNSHSIEKQLRNTESVIIGPNVTAVKSEPAMDRSPNDKVSLFVDLLVEKEVEEITSGLHKPMVILGDKDNERIRMQTDLGRLPRCKDSYCTGNGSDDARTLSNNTMAENGLVNNNASHNTSNPKEIAVDCCAVNDLPNITLHKNTRNRCVNNKTPLRKVRVRSIELPLTSSEEDLTSTMVGGGASLWSSSKTTRPQRKKQRNKPAKPTLSTRNLFSCQEPSQNLEQKLKELIDPGEIGNLHEEMAAANRPLLLAVMSPTDSGYIGSDAWKDYYEYSHSERSTPNSIHSSTQPSNHPISLYSSQSSFTPRYERIDPATSEWATRVERQEEVYLSPRSAHQSAGSHSSASSTVSYIGGSDYSETAYSEDCLSNHETTSRLSEHFPGPTRLPYDNYSSTVRLNEYLLNRHSIASPTSSVATSDLSDSFFGCESNYCECQTGIATEQDFREELKSISRYVLDARAKNEVMKKSSKSLKKYFLDEEQGEMDIFGAKLQKGEHKAVPILVKVILRLRKHFFGGLEGPNSLKSLSPRQEKSSAESVSRERKISFSPSAMLLSAVGESSASEIRDVIEKDGLDVNQLSPSGKSLLHKAGASGDLESIHTLIQYGAKVNLTDQDGFAPVHSALRRCHYKCAIFLIECGTDMAAYTRTRIQELSAIKSMSSEYMKSVLNTSL